MKRLQEYDLDDVPKEYDLDDVPVEYQHEYNFFEFYTRWPRKVSEVIWNCIYDIADRILGVWICDRCAKLCGRRVIRYTIVHSSRSIFFTLMVCSKCLKKGDKLD